PARFSEDAFDSMVALESSQAAPEENANNRWKYSDDSRSMGFAGAQVPEVEPAIEAIETESGAIYSTGFPGVANGEDGNPPLDGSLRVRGHEEGFDALHLSNFSRDQLPVESRARLGGQSDFTDDISPYIEYDQYGQAG